MSSEEFPLHQFTKRNRTWDFFGKRLPWCLKKIGSPHECLTAVLEYWEWGPRRTGLTIFPQGSRWRTSGTKRFLSLYTFHLLSFSPSSKPLQIHDWWVIYLVSFLLPDSRREAYRLNDSQQYLRVRNTISGDKPIWCFESRLAKAQLPAKLYHHIVSDQPAHKFNKQDNLPD